jgi:hypothetical protein
MKTSAQPELSEAAGNADEAPLDRRKAPRFPCEGTGDVIVLGGALHFSGELRDLSASGCRLFTHLPFTLERGTQVEVVMVVNHVQFRVAAGVRVNHKSRGVGLEFVNMSARCGRLVSDLIAELKVKHEGDRAKPNA